MNMTKVKSKTYFTTAPVTPCKTKMRSIGLSIITSSRKMGEKNIAEGEEITISTNIDEKEVVDNENNEAPGVQEEDEVVDNENDEAPGVQEEDTNQ